ncbi:hypothetical protein HDU79_000797, partial [Rhizoclosmatium sp. JEL0117]
ILDPIIHSTDSKTFTTLTTLPHPPPTPTPTTNSPSKQQQQRLTSITAIDRLLKIIYLAHNPSNLPAPHTLQQDLDAYFFDALERKSNLPAVPTNPCGLVVPREGFATQLFVKLVTEALRSPVFVHKLVGVSEVIGAWCWRVSGMDGFEVVVSALEDGKRGVEEELKAAGKEAGLDIVNELERYRKVREDGGDVGSVQWELDVELLERMLMLSEIGKEVTTLLMVRGGEIV